MKQISLLAGMLLLGATLVQAQDAAPARTLPTRLNPPVPPRAAAPQTGVTPPPAVQPYTPPPAVQPYTPPPPLSPMANNILQWDSEVKEYTTKPGEPEAHFSFFFTNVSAEVVVINSASASCGCTVPKLPQLPWTNAPSASGEIPVTMNLAGKNGTVFKTVTVNTDHGPKVLTVKANITPPVPGATPMVMDRSKNQELAKADRQKVFQGDCASCHVEKSRGKLGKELFDSSCGICHTAEHRASMVPDLWALKHDTNADYWKTWISLGKPGTLMPAFAHSQGGPLNEVEINSLVQYLVSAIPNPSAKQSGN